MTVDFSSIIQLGWRVCRHRQAAGCFKLKGVMIQMIYGRAIASVITTAKVPMHAPSSETFISGSGCENTQIMFAAADVASPMASASAVQSWGPHATTKHGALQLGPDSKARSASRSVAAALYVVSACIKPATGARMLSMRADACQG